MEIKFNIKSQMWGSESSRTDGLADTRVYKEVAMAKLSTKQNPTVLGGGQRVYDVGRTTTRVLGSFSNPRTRP